MTLKRLADGLISHARLVALLLILAALGGIWQAAQLRVEVDLTGLIGPDSEYAVALQDYNRRFAPLREEEVLLVTAPTLADEAALASLEDFLLDLQFIDGVQQVISLHSLPAPGHSGAWLGDPAMTALPPRTRLETLRTADPLAAQLLSADLRGTIVVVTPSPRADPDRFLADLETAGNASGLTVAPVGLAAANRAVAAELIRDLRVLTPGAVLICILIGGLLLRSVRGIAVCILPPLVGIAWFMGWMASAGITIDPVTGALPVLLFVLGFSDTMHIHHAAMHENVARHEDAVSAALLKTLPAALLASVTTMVAFGSLMLAGSPALDTMALAGAGGVVIMLAAVLLGTPVTMALLQTPPRGTRAPAALRLFVPPARSLMRLRGVPMASVVLLAVLILAQSQAQSGFRFSDYLPGNATVTETMHRAETLGLGADRVLVVVEAAPPVSAGDDANARAAALALWGEDSAQWLNSSAGAEMLARMRAEDGSAHALPLQLTIALAEGGPEDALREVAARLHEAGLEGQTRFVGLSHALVEEGPRLIEGLRLGLYLTIGVATVLIGVIHRSARIALVALVPNTVPLIGIEAWLFVIGDAMSITYMIALTVAFGIAVNDTLHFLNRLRLAGGDGTVSRLDRAIVTAGPPMVGTSLALMAGMTVTLTSALPAIGTFGLLIALAVGLALLADLFLLPGMLRWSLG